MPLQLRTENGIQKLMLVQSNIKKPCQPIPTVYIDNFQLKDIQIIAYTLIDEKSVDFSINRDEFETWCDENELREWNNDTYTGWSGWTEDNGTYDWEDIYNQSYEVIDHLIYDLLKKYVEFLYEQEAMDFQPALKKILSTHKAAI